MRPPPISVPFDVMGVPSREWEMWISDAYRHISANRGYNTTANRPINGMITGDVFFDTTLSQPVWWDGAQWVDATGSAA